MYNDIRRYLTDDKAYYEWRIKLLKESLAEAKMKLKEIEEAIIEYDEARERGAIFNDGITYD